MTVVNTTLISEALHFSWLYITLILKSRVYSSSRSETPVSLCLKFLWCLCIVSTGCQQKLTTVPCCLTMCLWKVDVQIGPGSLQNDDMSMIDLRFSMFFLLFANATFPLSWAKKWRRQRLWNRSERRKAKVFALSSKWSPPNSKQFRSYGSFWPW